MEKQDVNRAARTIRSLMRERRYKEVIKIARSLKLDRVNNGLLVLDIVEAYEHLGEKKQAKNTLMNYYDVHGITGRNMMQKLIELCIETGDINNAVGLCMEFENEWPESSISYLMRYQITTSAGGGLEERIYYLEKYKEAEFEERWGYELAKLYHKNDQQEECAAVCHELICFFGHGKYVEKAVQLKEKTTGLSEDEISILDAVKRREEEARIRREEEARLAREEAERLAREEEERLEREEAERLAREEKERLEREEEERLAQEEAERLSAEEEEARRNVWSQAQMRQQATWENAGNSEDEESIAAAAARKAREAEQEKIRQTEEAARLLREKREGEKAAREQKIAQAFKTSDRYAQVEKNKAERIYFKDLSVNEERVETKQKKKEPQQSNSIFSSFGRMASDFRKTLQPDDEYLEDTSEEIEYITIGRDSQAYAEDVEERMLGELDMLDDEQLDSLTSGQIKEIYELKILHDVRENIRKLIVDTDSSYKNGKSAQELERFVQSDPYPNPVNKNEQTAESGEDILNSERNEQEEAVKVIETEDKNKTISKEHTIDIEDTTEIVEEAEAETVGEITVEAEEETDTAGEAIAEAEEKADTAGEITVEAEVKLEKTGEVTVEAETKSETIDEAAVEEKEESEKTGEVTVEAEMNSKTIDEAVAEAKEESEEIDGAAAEEAAPKEEKTIQEPEENKTNGLPESIFKLKKIVETAESAVEKAVETVGGDKVKTSLEETTETIETEHVEPVAETEISRDSSEDSNVKEQQQEIKTTILDKIENADENLAVTEFIECITAYAATKGYEVDEMAYMTIAVLAEEMQQQKAPLSLNNARKMADEAIARVQKRNPLDKIMDRYSKKRAYILKDKHFYWNPQKG